MIYNPFQKSYTAMHWTTKDKKKKKKKKMLSTKIYAQSKTCLNHRLTVLRRWFRCCPIFLVTTQPFLAYYCWQYWTSSTQSSCSFHRRLCNIHMQSKYKNCSISRQMERSKSNTTPQKWSKRWFKQLQTNLNSSSSIKSAWKAYSWLTDVFSYWTPIT